MLFEAALSCAVVMSFAAYIPQMYAILNNKDSGSVSFTAYMSWAFVSLMFALHAYSINDIPLIVAQGIQFFFCIEIMILVLYYR